MMAQDSGIIDTCSQGHLIPQPTSLNFRRNVEPTSLMLALLEPSQPSGRFYFNSNTKVSDQPKDFHDAQGFNLSPTFNNIDNP